MALFTKRDGIRENRIENAGGWPIRQTDFFLIDDYEFAPSQYPEIFLVRAGNFLHETDQGTQAVRAGTAMVHHPSCPHVIKRPEQVHLTRIRFLPEWFAGEFKTIMQAPDAMGLFFAPYWFDIPTETRLHVFHTPDVQNPFLSTSFELLGQLLRGNRHDEPIVRITLLQIMLLLGDYYHVYWRGGNRLPISEKILKALGIIEGAVASGGRMPLKQLQATTGLSQDALTKDMRKCLGIGMVDYVQRRRLHHVARQLIATDDSPADIAAAFTFKDGPLFEKEFEKEFDFVPSAYREKFGLATDPASSWDED
jgi:AraC-like DNA-binding protein